MVSITLNKASVLFPIYSSEGRSLKNVVLSATTGGRIGRDRRNHVCVRALDQISLVINHGDRVGLVGHNGAGKTTLLRVLAGIFEPNEGSVIVEGKVTPMFDVSLGIDWESTGFENIILRGLYMGLAKAEILKRVDEIADFTELGEFLKLPVRTYSMGMQARLTFAMATCIQPEILLLDEGIGAGDASFLGKANQRLQEFMQSTGILVFASHQELVIREFCNKIIMMEHGRVVWMGDVVEGLARYRELSQHPTEASAA
jgi:ABC-2 type transport system ATP-binding protein/lipopolysaccharide transport system ATP-binding protein